MSCTSSQLTIGVAEDHVWKPDLRRFWGGIHPPTRPFVRQTSIHLSILHPFIHPSTRPSVRLSVPVSASHSLGHTDRIAPRCVSFAWNHWETDQLCPCTPQTRPAAKLNHHPLIIHSPLTTFGVHFKVVVPAFVAVARSIVNVYCYDYRYIYVCI